MTASLLTLPASASTTVSFSDISDHTTAVAAECLRLLGAMDGYGGGTFSPEGQVTRAQFCKMATFVIKDGESQLSRYRTVTVFPDVKPSHWAAPYINLASDAGRGATGEDKTDNSIIKGFMDGKFHPERVVTVGQAVTILMRLLGYTDADMGGIWPDGYMAAASTVGLTDGVSTAASVPLTRATAARLFVNLLRSDAKGGGSYGTSIAASSVEGMLTTSSATAPDGSDTAMRLGNSTSYSIAGGKVSTGAMNGMKGILLLNKAGKVMTFVPEIAGSSRTVVFASGTAVKLTTASGESFTIKGDTAMVVNGEQKTWETGYTWLNPGTSLTLYIGGSGTVEYIFAGVSATASTAVVVYEKGSTSGFSDLAGGNSRYSIYKNGGAATAGDMRPYDVAIYSPATNAIRVCDTRITGVYENASPNLTNPSKITLMGTEFSVMPTATDTMSKLKLGSAITLLLTEDNQVAGAVEAGTKGISGNAVGILNGSSVRLLSGLEIKGTLTVTGDALDKLKNQLVSVASDQKGKVSVSRMIGNVPGDWDVSARKIGNKLLAANVAIFQTTSSGLQAVAVDKISATRVASSGIVSCRTNWAGQIDLILVSSLSSGDYRFGRLQFNTVSTEDPLGNPNGYSLTSVSILTGFGTQLGPFNLLADKTLHSGDWVAAEIIRDSAQLGTVYLLTKYANISNAAWSNASSVTISGRSYTVPTDVLCYNKANGTWITLDEARSFSTSATLYTDKSGYVRVVEVQ